MQPTVNFDYFYGGESELFSYYRIPRLLVTGAHFKDLSMDAKLLYGLLLDRMSLSAKNGWYDSNGRVYIYYPLNEVEADLCCGHGKAVRLMAELDIGTGIGLIERVRQGLGKPSIIYVKQFTSRAVPLSTGPPVSDDDNELPEVPKSNFKKSDNETSRLPIIEPQEVPKSDVPYNKKIVAYIICRAGIMIPLLVDLLMQIATLLPVRDCWAIICLPIVVIIQSQ